jgi:hypothetical protein
MIPKQAVLLDLRFLFHTVHFLDIYASPLIFALVS